MISKDIKNSIKDMAKINLKISNEDLDESIELLSKVLLISQEVDKLKGISDKLKEAYSENAKFPKIDSLNFFEPFCKTIVYITDKKFFDENESLTLGTCLKKLKLIDENVLKNISKRNEKGQIINVDRQSPEHPLEKYRNHKDWDIIGCYVLRNTLAHESNQLTDYDYFWYYRCLISAYLRICLIFKKDIFKHLLTKNDYAKKCIKKYDDLVKEGYHYIQTKVSFKAGNTFFNNIDKDDIKINEIHNKYKLPIIKIIGYAGVGKTSLLEYIRYEELKKYEENSSNNKLSLIIPLINVLKDIEIEQIISDIVEMPLENTKLLLNEKKFNLYFDGINEIRIDTLEEKEKFLRRLEDFIKEYASKSANVIITDRDNNDESIFNEYKEIPTFIIQGFSDDEINEFIDKNASDSKKDEIKTLVAIYKENDKSLYEELKKPFFLSQFIILAENNEKIPDNTLEITQAVLKTLVDREITLKHSHIAEYILKAMRYVLKNIDVENIFYIDSDDLYILLNKYKKEVLGKDAYDAHDLVKLMIKMGILKDSDINLGGYVFTQESFYYALIGDAK